MATLDDDLDNESMEVIDEIASKSNTRKKRATKGRLTNTRCYLAGPIDNADDDGVAWRVKFTEILKRFGVIALDPTNKPTSQCKYNEIGDEKDLIEKLVALERWDELREMAKEIVLVDLRMVEVSDFLVAYVNTDISMCGTWDEIFESLRQRKPTYVVVEGGKAKMPMWLRGKLNHNFCFASFEELEAYLDALHKGVVEPDYTRWVFFDKV
tara:strand:+ start:270 stop:902 length:633 start_codon:yes stop_codon:yes gene_type:complete